MAANIAADETVTQRHSYNKGKVADQNSTPQQPVYSSTEPLDLTVSGKEEHKDIYWYTMSLFYLSNRSKSRGK